MKPAVKGGTSLARKLNHEVAEFTLTALFFLAWLGVLIVLKELVLAEYQIHFRGISLALIGALVIAKVVLVMEHVPLGKWVRTKPAAVDVLLRTLLYGAGVAVMLLLEKAFEARHEYGGFGRALANIFQHRDIHHVWANTLCVTCALLAFNVLSIVRAHLGRTRLLPLFWLPRPDASGSQTAPRKEPAQT